MRLLLALVGLSMSVCLCAASPAESVAAKSPARGQMLLDPTGPQAAALEAYRNLPFRFEANRGQTDPQAKFLSRQAGQMLFLTADGAVLVLKEQEIQGRTAALRLSWVGANRQARITGVGELPGKSHYLIGAAPEWHTQVPHYASVRYANMYPGIDLLYHGEGGQLEYDFILAPGARPEAIGLRLSGAEGIHLDAAGDVIVDVAGQSVRLRKPVLYQSSTGDRTDVSSRREYIDGRFVVTRRGDIRFEVGAYDRSRSLIIDPQITYSSYVGGSGSDYGKSIAVDAAGNAYIVGWSASLNFPTMSPLQPTNTGTDTAVIVKLNPELPGAASLQFATYLGGSAGTHGRGIALDAAGDIYVAGDTASPNFPVTAGAYQTSCKQSGTQCSTDVFAAKIDATGSSLLYSTYLGGTGSEFGFGLAIDGAGHMFLTGPTGSSNFPTTAGAYQPSFRGGDVKFGDVYITKLNPAGGGASDLEYSSYLGGSGSDSGMAIAVDGSQAVYVGGWTASSTFPTTTNAYSTTYAGKGSLGHGDAFVAKLQPAGAGPADLVYSTYLGGALDDQVEGLAVDGQGLVYVTGLTMSSGFPVTSAVAYQTAFGGGTCYGAPCADAFVAKLDPFVSGLASLRYSTFFGGSSFDLGHAIALDSAGVVYITGESASANLPLMNPVQGTCASGCTPLPMDDALVAKFDLSQSGQASLLFSTYVGGSNVDTGWAIAVDSNGNAFVTGQVFSPNFPTVIPFQSSCSNCTPFSGPSPSGDLFLVKVCTTGCPEVSVAPATLTFESLDVGVASAAQNVTLTNTGGGDLTLVSIGISGASSGDFSQVNDCPVVLAPQGICTANVTFTPTVVGGRNASLTFVDNVTGSPHTVGLTGTGAGSLPAVGLSPNTLVFPGQPLNTPSAAQNIAVTNSGPGDLSIASIVITGANAVDFSSSQTCPLSPATLPMSGTCTVTVTFTPTAAGVRSAAVTLTDNGIGSPRAASLSGVGGTSLPDLATTVINNAPPSAAPGTAFSVTDTVQNSGTSSSAATTTRYYLSLDAVKDGIDLLLTGTRSVGSLAAGATSTGSVNVTIPGTTALDTYRVLACADDLVKVAEPDETNNCRASAGSVLVGWPDFVESAVGNPPASAAPGTAFTVTDTMQNGGMAIGAATTTRYYLSLDAVKDAGDVLLTGTRGVTSLAPGAVSSGSANVTVPGATALATYRVLVCADDLVRVVEKDETNNCRTSANSVLIGWPDFIEIAVGNPPASAAPGTAFSVTDTVQNGGTAIGAATTTRFYLSLDAVKDASDLLLTSTRGVASLAPGAMSSGAVNVTVPASAPLGTYQVIACADDLVKVAESNEINNCRASANSVLIGWPDFIESSVGNPPASAAPGTAFSVTDTVQNSGAAIGAATTTRYYLSLDVVKDGSDLLLTGTRAVAVLAPGATSSGSANVTIPGTTALGTYRVLVCADDLVKVTEAEETNNCRASASTVVVGWPDFVESVVGNPPASAAPGTAFSVMDTVQNSGTAIGAATTTRYHLSLDAVRDGGDLLLAATRGVTSLAPGATATGSANVTVPAGTPLGTYQLLACADDLVKVTEADETNNCRASASSLVVGWPDFIEIAVGNPPAGAAPGTAFSVADTVQNVGAAIGAAATTRYYLSLDAVRDGSDLLLTASRGVSILAPGATAPGSANVTVPASTPLGSYRMLACADDLVKVPEGDEANNCRASASTVLIGWPDLVVSAISTPPASVAPGATFTVTDTVMNQGQSPAVGSTTRYYLSADAIKDAGDTLLAATRPVGSLTPGATSTGSRSVTVPAPTPGGRYVLLLCADDLGQVTESNDANNCGASVDFMVGSQGP